MQKNKDKINDKNKNKDSVNSNAYTDISKNLADNDKKTRKNADHLLHKKDFNNVDNNLVHKKSEKNNIDIDDTNIKKFINIKEEKKQKEAEEKKGKESGHKDVVSDSNKSFTEKTKIFFADLKLKFKNMFAPEKEKTYLPEFYDLPYRYNKDTVKVLAQTPHKLFVYWDFNDTMKNEVTEKYGEDFWHKSYPVLIVENLTKKYSFEIKIDDFANSWYIDIPDNASRYNVTIGRKLIENFEYNPRLELEKKKQDYVEKYIDKENLTKELLERQFEDEFKEEIEKIEAKSDTTYRFKRDDFIYFGRSNELVSPNGKVLLSTLKEFMLFKDINSGKYYNMKIDDTKSISKLYDVEFGSNTTQEKVLSGSSWMTSSSGYIPSGIPCERLKHD